jgi:hypothetical protein
MSLPFGLAISKMNNRFGNLDGRLCTFEALSPPVFLLARNPAGHIPRDFNSRLVVVVGGLATAPLVQWHR